MLNKSFLSTKTARILLPILVSLISFLAYLNTLNHQFVFDDFRIITNNPYIKDWKYFSALFNRDYFKISGELSYRPLVTLSYFIDYSIWHLNPFGFHLTNLLIHSLNTFIVYLLIFKITRRFNLTGISCLFFGIHPILTETVNSVGFREDLLCATFFLLTLLFYAKLYTSKYKKICYVASLLTYLIALFSKEMAISLPLIIFFLDLFFPQAETYLKKKIIRYYLGFICMSIAYILLRLVFFKSTIEHVAYPGNSLATNFLTMTKVVASYIKLWFFPVILNPDYHVTFETTVAKPPFLLSVALLICVVVITLRLYKKQKELTFSILWTFITLIPVMNVVPIGNIMAERYLYIPSLGFCLFLGILIVNIHVYIHAYRSIAKICFIGILIFYFIFTIKQNRFWSDEQTLWSRTVSDTSCSFNAHNNLGKEYFQKGLVDKAIEEYTIALAKASEVQYEYPIAHFNLGIAYDEKGMYEAAIREYKNALRIEPKNGDAHNNLAITLFKNGQVDLAIEEFNKAILFDPNNPIYHQNLAKLYYEINMPDRAKAEQELANRLKNNK
ncbi:MAG TPA: tetratricopeptide repeat protein [Candidatus Wunengus sp. YC60]|uniref:tetratricopeptide repeat protein n=1 Tax=Candidatus Wunengus sp. YC60 TaxID=3367697 RepID=UPI00402832A3